MTFPRFSHFRSFFHPSQDLVDNGLREIPGVEYFSPEAFANALCGMTQLRTLSLHPLRRTYLSLPPSQEVRLVLLALTRLKDRGVSKYLDSFISRPRLNAPHLRDIDNTFFNQPTFDALQLGLFVNRPEIQRSPLRADILSTEGNISVTVTHPGRGTIRKRGGVRDDEECASWTPSHGLDCKYRASN